MRHYNIHFSPTGGTKKVADIICGTLEGDFNEIDLCCNSEQTSPLDNDDICMVSVPLICKNS
jgi:flavodoxin